MEIKREVIFKDSFESKIKKGIDTLSNAVKTTMGPKGKLVLIQREGQHPIVTKDGVTVANSINLVDEVENLGVKVLKEAASRTADEAGDGTTTSTVLAQAIFNEGLKMKSAGFQIDLIKRGIDSSLKLIKDYLFEAKKDVTSNEELKQVAMISANGEEEIANLIVDAIQAAGPDGSVIVEEAKGFKSELNVVDGFRLERGYLSPYFVTDKNKMTCEFERPLILIADREFNTIHDLMKPLETALDSSRPILIIGNDIQGDALQGMVLNKVKGSLRVCAIKSPGFGGSRHDMLVDLQSVIGGEVITSSFNMSEFKMEHFGTCEKCIIHKNMTMIISKDTKQKNKKIEERIDSIRSRLLERYSLQDGEENILKYRLQQLSGGIAILRVGAATESELIERYDRVDDALHATRAALQEGILPGGGVALARSSKKLKELSTTIDNPDIKAGVEIMLRAVTSPFKQIIKNGNKSDQTLLDAVIEKDNNTGYDSRNNKFGDMYSLGIVDPHKVVRCAIENATSAATMLLSVECCLISLKQENSEDNYN
jgi:chaperonin GroEL